MLVNMKPESKQKSIRGKKFNNIDNDRNWGLASI